MIRLVVVGLLAALTFAVPAPARADFSTPVAVTSSSDSAESQPAIDASASGHMVMATVVNGDTLEVRRMSPKGSAWGPAKVFHRSTEVGRLDVAIDDQGRACVLWEAEVVDVMAVEAHASCYRPGKGWTPVKTVNTPGTHASSPDVVLNDGVATFFWAGGSSAWRTRYRVWGGAWGPIKSLKGRSALLEAGVSANGRITLVEEYNSAGKWHIAVRTSTLSGGWSARKEMCPADVDCDQGTVEVVANGSAMVAWRRQRTTHVSIEVRHRTRFGKWKSFRGVHDSQDTVTPQLTSNGIDDVFDVFMVEYDGANDLGTIWFARRFADGTWPAGSFSVETSSASTVPVAAAQMDRDLVTTYAWWRGSGDPVLRTRVQADGITVDDLAAWSDVANTTFYQGFLDLTLRGRRQVHAVWAENAPSQPVRTTWAFFAP